MTVVQHMWIGSTSTAQIPGGIWRLNRSAGGDWADSTAQRMLTADHPSFLALHPAADRLFAVGEGDPGTVSSYAVDAECALRRTAVTGSGGAGPCHLLVHPQGHWLYASNYGDGSLGAIALTEAGDVSDHVVSLPHAGSGPVSGRQDGPHAHSANLSAGGEFLIVADLGTDQLRAYPLDMGRPDPEPILTDLPPGTGPRHLVVAGDFVYVAGELSGEVLVLAWDSDGGRGEVIQRVAASTLPGRSADVHQLSHLLAHRDSLVVGVRGADAISTFSVSEDGSHIELTGEVVTAAWPRHHEIVGSELLVAGERADEVAIHPIADGVIGPVRASVALPTPMFILPV
ncbi:lactonase family protein [Occultella glacieicola]|uniref:Lactonase family protein n=1 Tax=Occultella glacieicola TaxID=2518684 RepID=A0ABY2E3N8_9MICO|nr:beta-propeller fold lactonase family protein [Occultella glacieicola]TDE94244.1 lactonase family protein [Occultella glacieicola]